jgi:hypothetical protein
MYFGSFNSKKRYFCAGNVKFCEDYTTWEPANKISPGRWLEDGKKAAWEKP